MAAVLAALFSALTAACRGRANAADRDHRRCAEFVRENVTVPNEGRSVMVATYTASSSPNLWPSR